MGIVWVYGGSEEALKRWFNLYEGLLEDGGRTWIWIFSEGSGGGELRFKRYASDRESWATVYRVPSALADEDGMRQMRREVLEVLDGYIPKLDRKVKFGRF